MCFFAFFNFEFIFIFISVSARCSRSRKPTMTSQVVFDYVRKVEEMLLDERIEFALQLMDPQNAGSELFVPSEFRVMSTKDKTERNKWGILDGEVALAVGVHYGVDVAYLKRLIEECVRTRCPSTISSLRTLLSTIGSNGGQVNSLCLATNDYYVENEKQNALVTSLIAHPMKIVAATLPFQSYLGTADVQIYKKALTFLRSTLQSIHRMKTICMNVANCEHLSLHESMIFEHDERWQQMALWIRLKTCDGSVLLANPFRVFFRKENTFFDRSNHAFTNYPGDYSGLKFTDVWKQDDDVGQYPVIKFDSVSNTGVIGLCCSRHLTDAIISSSQTRPI